MADQPIGTQRLPRMPQGPPPYRPHEADIIFALDAQYVGERAFVALDIQTWAGERLGTAVGVAHVTMPYVPGRLRFREGPPLLAMIAAARERLSLRPDLILVDGHGTAHPQRCGLACWVGAGADTPTIGCAKETLLRYNGPVGRKRGDALPIELDGEAVGVALTTRDGVRPVFVSPGHRVSLSTAIEVVLHLTPRYRLPEPLHRADHAARSCAKGILPTDTFFWGQLNKHAETSDR